MKPYSLYSLCLTMLCFHVAQAATEPAPPALPAQAVYAEDPAHPWNQLYAALYLRALTPEDFVDTEQLDPVLWTGTGLYLLKPPTHAQAIALLDDFLENDRAALIDDPLRRALLQRDLWAVYDWTFSLKWFSPRQQHYYPELREAVDALRPRLVQIMKRVALTEEEIAGLPDVLADAGAAGVALPAARDRFEETADFVLAADLCREEAGWRLIIRQSGQRPTALEHAESFGARAVFELHARFPEEEDAEQFLAALAAVEPPKQERPSIAAREELMTALPAPAEGTQFILLRRTLLIDTTGALRESPIVEQLQTYTLRGIIPQMRMQPFHRRSFHEARLSRARASAGEPLLAPVDNEARDGFLTVYQSHGTDYFERARLTEAERFVPHRTLECATCHGGSPGGFLTSSRALLMRPDHALGFGSREEELRRTILEQQGRSEWAALQEYWE